MKDFNSIILGEDPSQPAPICNRSKKELLDEINLLVQEIDILRGALNEIINVYVEVKDEKFYSIRTIKIGQSSFNNAFDAFELARKALTESNGIVSSETV